jgi:hypothetical protein
MTEETYNKANELYEDIRYLQREYEDMIKSLEHEHRAYRIENSKTDSTTHKSLFYVGKGSCMSHPITMKVIDTHMKEAAKSIKKTLEAKRKEFAKL